jgi:hypothetical protein
MARPRGMPIVINAAAMTPMSVQAYTKSRKP